MFSLSDSDTETLQRIGRDLIQNGIAIVVEAILWTAYLSLVVIAGHILLRRGRTTASFLIFFIILAMFFMKCALCIIDIHDFIKEISYTLTSDSSMPLADRYALTAGLPYPAESAIFAFMSNLGDIIIIWRVHAFYQVGDDRWVLLLPLSMLAGSFVTSGLLSFCAAQPLTNFQAGDFVNPPFCQNVQMASYSTTLVTTGVATMLISYKAWLYRQHISRHLESSSKKRRVQKFMLIIIESGVLYFLFFLKLVIAQVPRIGDAQVSTPELQFASTIWTYQSSHIVGMYPVILVIIVKAQLSYIEAGTAADSMSHEMAFGQPSCTSSTLPIETVTPGTANTARDHNVNVDEDRAINQDMSLSTARESTTWSVFGI